ncbi:hypothetical protein [Acidithiobacillus ferriphilus]|uniref:hypothetical protein n=1 Tax=Acidithiobacillus ferriphilus TaxID=1689834 RepID=UPI002DBC5CDA|nr:hypothetical protein [Acidithiobacillus ferriphilus]MEB8536950.1 hypothetical protein [Acidithiobacillus ferriphilus]
MDVEEQSRLEASRLDSIVRRLACRGCVSEASARRLVNDLFLREEITDRYVRIEVGYVALGLSTFQLGPPIAIHETINRRREIIEQSPDNQPKPRILTEEELQRLNDERREMRFLSMPVPGRPDHYRWLATILEEEAPEILRVWNRYCCHAASLERYREMLEEEPDPYRSAEEEAEEASKGKPWPKESVREFVRSARANMVQAKRVWNRERRKYWPVRLVVDNTVGEDANKAG